MENPISDRHSGRASRHSDSGKVKLAALDRIVESLDEMADEGDISRETADEIIELAKDGNIDEAHDRFMEVA